MNDNNQWEDTDIGDLQGMSSVLSIKIISNINFLLKFKKQKVEKK